MMYWPWPAPDPAIRCDRCGAPAAGDVGFAGAALWVLCDACAAQCLRTGTPPLNAPPAAEA